MSDRPRRAPIARAPRGAVALAVVLVGLCVGSYTNGLPNDFTFDDHVMVPGRPASELSTSVVDVWTGPNWGSDRDLYRPVTVLSFLANGAIASGPSGYRLFNIVLHIACTLLVWSLARLLLADQGAAGLGAALFAVHPIHTEAVTSIVGRAELACTLFSLLTLRFFLAFRDAAGRRRRTACLLAACASFFLALLSKETAFALPALITATDWCRRRSTGPAPSPSRRRTVAPYAALASVLGAALALRAGTIGGCITAPDGPPISATDNPLATLPLLERALGAVHVWGRYVWLLVYPRDLSPDYSFDAIPLTTTLGDPRVLLPLALLAASFSGLVAAVWRRSGALFAAAAFFVPLAPVSNVLFPIRTIMGERLLYLPSVGFCLTVGLAFAAAWRRLPHRVVRVALASSIGLMVALHALRTIDRNRDWADDRTLFTRALEVVPRSAKMLHANARAMREAGHLEEALRLAERSQSIDPTYWPGCLNAGILLARLGRGEEAITKLEVVIRVAKREARAGALVHLAAIHQRAGRHAETAHHASRALAIEPDSVPALDYLASALAFQGRCAAAVEHYHRLTRLAPTRAKFQKNLGVLYMNKLREPRRALAHFRRSLAIDPAQPEARAIATDIETLERRLDETPSIAKETRARRGPGRPPAGRRTPISRRRPNS